MKKKQETESGMAVLSGVDFVLGVLILGRGR